jgi:hypothetical protein
MKKTSITKKAVVRRKGSAASKIKQLDWLMQFVIRMNPCAICGGSLADGYNPRYPGKSITLHHTEGSREVDDWENLEYVAGMVLCHSSCHKSYHLKLRHMEAGKEVDAGEIMAMEENIGRIVMEQRDRVASAEEL